jgi:hypothetical protein
MDKWVKPVKFNAKRLRKGLAKVRLKALNPAKFRTTTTFFNLANLPIPESDKLQKLLSIWNHPMFTNLVKTFILKFFHNILGLNTRVFHFVANYNRKCQLCIARDPRTVNDESFAHLFASCPVANLWRKKWLKEIFNKDDIIDTSLPWRRLWFLGNLIDECDNNPFIQTLVFTFQFIIWECKLQHRAPSYHTIITRFNYLYGDMLKLNKSVLYCSTNKDYPICRLLAARGPARAPRRP